jgi:uncharacterized RDD family membrane protein YckC
MVGRMFTIIGGDGQEYGPATVDQVRGWLSAGRANLRTKARALGSEEWRQLGDFPEFGGPSDVPPPPVLPGSAPTTAATTTVAGTAAAGVGARTGAALINAAIYFFCMMPGSMIMTRQLLEQNPDLAKGVIPRLDEIDLTGFRDAQSWVFLGLVGAMFVQCVLLALRGQNIGKMLVGLRVERVGGQRAGALRATILRFVLPVMIVLFLNVIFPLGCFFLAVDYAFMFRADRRCLHDLMAGTRVVRA